jgi:hypothetical protein
VPVASSPSGSTGPDRATIPDLHRVVVALDLGGVEAFVQRHAERYGTSILAAGAVLAAALVKGAIGFGFPTLGTPLLSLLMDVKTAVVVLIVPNIAMDGIQFVRRGSPLAIVRRFAPLLVGGAVGTVVGTRLLMALSSRVALLVLGLFIVLFVALTAAGVTLRVSPRGERWASPLVGLLTGIAVCDDRPLSARLPDAGGAELLDLGGGHAERARCVG